MVTCKDFLGLRVKEPKAVLLGWGGQKIQENLNSVVIFQEITWNFDEAILMVSFALCASFANHMCSRFVYFTTES